MVRVALTFSSPATVVSARNPSTSAVGKVIRPPGVSADVSRAFMRRAKASAVVSWIYAIFNRSYLADLERRLGRFILGSSSLMSIWFKRRAVLSCLAEGSHEASVRFLFHSSFALLNLSPSRRIRNLPVELSVNFNVSVDFLVATTLFGPPVRPRSKA